MQQREPQQSETGLDQDPSISPGGEAVASSEARRGPERSVLEYVSTGPQGATKLARRIPRRPLRTLDPTVNQIR